LAEAERIPARSEARGQ